MIIHTEGLTRRFGTLTAVDRLSLEIPRGTIFGFLGPNGAGKTTTIRLLLGLLEPSGGRAEVLGHDPVADGDAVRRQAGALLEHAGLYERLSAEANLEFYGRIGGLTAGERRSRVRELLAHLGLWERRGESVGSWSRGMKQKLAVARAMLHRPPLIFLDEPTAGLDPLAAAALREDLAAMVSREGTTVFLTTHNLTEAERLCSQVAVIRQGRLLATGRPDDLRRRLGGTRVEFAGTGFTPAMATALEVRPEVAGVTLQSERLLVNLQEEAPVAPLVSLLTAMGASLEEVRREQAGLDEVFRQLMEEEAC